jgi:hypothetical protein
MLKARWLQILATTLLASGCGIVLGVFLLSIYTNADMQAFKNQDETTDFPKVVQASAVTLLADDLLEQSNNDSESNNTIEDNNTIEAMLQIRDREWYFVQAGVFNDPSLAYPIVKQIQKHGIQPQLIFNNPSRVMLGGFTNINQANNIVKQLSVIGVELYVKELKLRLEPTSVVVPIEQNELINDLQKGMEAYFKLIANYSTTLITGKGNDNMEELDAIINVRDEMVKTLDTVLLIEANYSNELLIAWKEQLQKSKLIINNKTAHNTLSGWALQEHLLSLLALLNLSH